MFLTLHTIIKWLNIPIHLFFNGHKILNIFRSFKVPCARKNFVKFFVADKEKSVSSFTCKI